MNQVWELWRTRLLSNTENNLNFSLAITSCHMVSEDLKYNTSYKLLLSFFFGGFIKMHSLLLWKCIMSILNISFCVKQKKERHRAVNDDWILMFVWAVPLMLYSALLIVMHRSWFFVADSDTDFFRANWPIPIPIPIFFPLSNQQEIMKDSNTNKVFI